jgi:uncharacterized protein (TIGR02996 family)
MNDEQLFLEAIKSAPDDFAPRGIYADWLDEHDRPIEAGIYRQWKPLEGKPKNPVGWGGNVSVLLGKTLADVLVNHAADEITFAVDDGSRFRMYHSQDCCESVKINDIIGDVKDLIGSPLLMAEESQSNTFPDGFAREPVAYEPESMTWTFYRFATIKGYVTIRWWGESNGYYSESVDFASIP